MQFVHQGLLFGALLFAVPLIIHLLNRKRYKRRRWAAMEFLLNAYKKQRRRLRTENLLLLLLRCLIPVILALALARPVLRDVSGVASLGGTAHHLLVLDASYSMGVQPEGARSPFQRTKTLCAQLLERLEGRKSQKVSIMTCGIRPSLKVQDDMNLTRAKTVIANLRRPEDSAADLTLALTQVAELVESSTDPEIRVYLFTDLQARAFGRDPFARNEGGPEPAREGPERVDPAMFEDTARDAIQRIAERGSLTVLDVSGLAAEAANTTTGNLQVTDLRLGRQHAVAKVPVPIVATLRNRTDASRVVQVTLEIEGGEPARKSTRLEAGAEGQVEILVTFREVGLSHVRVQIDGDGLAADNERFLVVPVRDRLRLLLVEGSQTNDPTLMESELLRAVLDPTRGRGSPEVTVFAPKVIDSTELLLGRENLQDYDLIALANVDRLNETAGTAIKQAVKSGTGLLVMLGDNTEIASFNEQLHGVGDGPLPMRLTRVAGFRPGGNEHFVSEIVQPDHPVFADFDQPIYREAFQQTPVYRFVAGRIPAGHETARVLARVRDPFLSPLLVAATYGSGKVLCLTSTVSRRPDRWNRFEWPGIAFPLFHQAVYWLTLPAADPFNTQTGAPLTTTLRHRPSDVAVLLPERAGSGKVLVGEDSRPVAGGRHTLPTFRDTRFAGIYTFEARLDVDGQKRTMLLPFAVNPDPVEGNLTYMSHREVGERLGVRRIVRALPSEGEVPVESGLSDLGVPLMYLALLLLLGEAALARSVSRRRA